MLRIRAILPIILLSLFLFGCQNNNFDLDEEVTSIEVYEWEETELISVIEDREFIATLVKQLTKAKINSTANMDFEAPDYRLVFKGEDDILLEFGYYSQVMSLGVDGRYWDQSEDVIYAVTLQLPLILSPRN